MDVMITLSIFTKPNAAGAHPSFAEPAVDLLILVALRGGALRKVFDDRVREYKVLLGRGPNKIRFVWHGSYCGGHGNPSCEKTQRITSEPIKFEQPNR